MSRKRHQQRHPVNETQRANFIQIIPKTDKQRDLLKALDEYQQVFISGNAGTGKTYVATTHACREFLYGRAKRIIITRPAVAACVENLGFLPGSLQSKVAPWAMPVTSVIEEHLGKAQTQEALRNGSIEIVPFGYLRGRSFKDCYILLDEAQNTTREQMELILTRIGEGSRIVVSGDLKQSDIGKQSGLQHAMELVEKYRIPAGVIRFTKEDCVRSALCKLWVEAYDSN